MVPVATTGGYYRYGDSRALNNAIIPDRYPVLHHQDFGSELFIKSVFLEDRPALWVPPEPHSSGGGFKNIRCHPHLKPDAIDLLHMDVSNLDIDAQLLEQFSSLGTDDREDLIKAFQRVVGHEVTAECSRFFLELANWNLQKGIGAYFDYSFEAAPETSVQTHTIRHITVEESSSQSLPEPALYSARVYHSPNSDFKKTPTLIWCVQNSGPSAWPAGSYIAAEVSLVSSVIPEIDRLIYR
ncbi:unnamed protein product [Dibothriocephalus latus]|uniref:Uncharacterized protein n=1 Tax=Dibothriocephalus latus TaxID=60516 RepID=A0A3P7LRU1_DIBLA|nr:unnamed protein product [Dibothriocephalus latus]